MEPPRGYLGVEIGWDGVKGARFTETARIHVSLLKVLTVSDDPVPVVPSDNILVINTRHKMEQTVPVRDELFFNIGIKRGLTGLNLSGFHFF